ncbi:lantibiotic immunity ABC transporter MutG family permease subunit [Lachnospiraceae bacterium ZAX-1]
MAVIRGIRSEFIKLHHTAFLWIHALIPVLGAALFLLYFALYYKIETDVKMALVLELTSVVFPIIISVVCGMMITLEEKAGNFQGMLSNQNGRAITYLNKLLTAILLGGLSVGLLVILTLCGSTILSLVQLPVRLFTYAALGMFLGVIPLYIIHMFLSVQWGLSVSVFVGVVESLLAVMFSNVNTGIWPFIPCAWSVKIIQNTLSIVNISGMELTIVTALSMIFLLLSFIWFQKWEGRKSFE